MPDHHGIPAIQLDANWLEEMDLEDNFPDSGSKGAHDGLTIGDASNRRKSVRLEGTRSITDCGKGVQDGAASGDHDDQGRLEDQMNYDHLRRLEDIFKEADQDGGGGLDIDEFCESMKKLMGNKVEESELEKIFMKVDTNCDGTVDWDEYLSYMLLEYQGQDSMNMASNEQIFPTVITEMASLNRDPIIRICFLKHLKIRYAADGTPKANSKEPKGKYVTCTRDGMVSFYELDQELVSTHKIETKGKWMTDMITMSNTQQLVFSTADRDIFIYDVGGGKFERKYHLVGMQNAVMCLDYWFNYDNLNRSGLVCGDTDGGVIVFQFSDTLKKGLFPKKHITNNKGLTDIRMLKERQDARNDPFLEYHYSYYPKLHSDWVRQVMFLEMAQGVQCFISCSHTDKNSMHLRELSDQIDEGATRYVKRLTSNRNMVFHSRKGFISFDYSREWNLIITGGLDGSVKFWNPHIEKPSTTMQTHQTGVCFISIMHQTGQVITVGQDKSIHILELRDMSVSQKITPRSSAALAGSTIYCAYFNSMNRSLLVGAMGLGIFQSTLEEVPIMKNSTMTMARTHEGVVSETLYNGLFNQVVTGGHDGYVIVWDMFNGQKIIQFTVENGVEITAMCFDESKRRLITGTRTGNVQIWNFNNGAMLHALPKTSDVEITSLNYIRERIISGGWVKRITVYHDPKENSEYKEWDPMHEEDILSMSIYSNKSLPAVVVASASYDGDIYIWSLETGSVLSKLNRIESFSTQTSRKIVLPRVPKQNSVNTKAGRSTMTKSALARDSTMEAKKIVPRETLPNVGRDNVRESKVEVAEKRTTGRSHIVPVGDDHCLGRRLSMSSCRRSTLNINDLEAIQRLSTCGEKSSNVDEVETRPTRSSRSSIASRTSKRKSNLSAIPDNAQLPRREPQDEVHDFKRNIFFGNTSKNHPKGAEALDIKLKNLMNIDNSKYWEANTSIEKIIFLNARKHHPETASLLASGDLGWVFAWSVHRQGGLLGQFTATSNDNESVTAMVCSNSGEVLVTADSEGYIRAWNIEQYCIHNEGGRRSRRMRNRTGALPKINITEDVVLSDKRNRQINNIPPDQIFQFHAHVTPITVLSYCDEYEVLFSASTDGTVRCWAMTGKYIGTFGQKRLWNLRHTLDDPRPPPATYRLPPDIRRVASYETLRLFNHGINSWKLAKNIMNILTIKNRIKNLKNAFAPKKKGALGQIADLVKKKEQEEKENAKKKEEENASQDQVRNLPDKPIEAKQSKPSQSKPSLLSVKMPGGDGRRKSFIGTARNVIQINALTKPEETIEEKYEACLERLGQSKYMATYEPRNLTTNVQYEKIKMKVDLRRVLNSLPVVELHENPTMQQPQVLKEQMKVNEAQDSFRAKAQRKESTGSGLIQPKKSIRSLFAETARVKKVINMFKKGQNKEG